MVVEAIGILLGHGVVPETYTSANVAGGDDANARFGPPEAPA
jgi:uncharacterized phosphosugar-binding protein